MSGTEKLETYEEGQARYLDIFATSLESIIEKYGGIDEVRLVKRQKSQVERLVALEKAWRNELIAHLCGPGVYRQFVGYILHERKNILAARPYFRERSGAFASAISGVLKSNAPKALYKFHPNFQFITFVMGRRTWGKSSKLVKLFNQIKELRNELAEMNLPLAVSRARIFWSKTPRGHLSYMDLISICCEGLLAAIDKFCLPYSKVFRSVAIGRMIGYLIGETSQTPIHFYPSDKRKIYRANKVAYTHVGGIDFDRLAEQVNEGVVDDAYLTTPAEIADLMAAASCVSSDLRVLGHDNLEMSDAFEAGDSSRPDHVVEEQNAISVLGKAIGQVSPLERKVLRMKGITL